MKVGDRVHIKTLNRGGEIVSIDGYWFQILVDKESLEDWFYIDELESE